MAADDVRLIFIDPVSTAPANQLDLVFGSEGNAGSPGSIAHIGVDLSAPPVLKLFVGPRIPVTVGVDLNDTPVLAMAVTYDLGVSRGPRRTVGASWQTATPSPVQVSAEWTAPVPRHISTRVGIVDAQPLRDVEVRTRWEEGQPLTMRTSTAWDGAAPLRIRPTTIAAHEGLPVKFQRSTGWQEAAMLRPKSTTFRYQETLRVHQPISTGYEEARPVHRSYTSVAADADGLVRSWVVPWQEARRAPPGTSVIVVPPVDPDLCYTPPAGDSVELAFDSLWDGSTDLIFVCDNHPVDPGGPGATVTVPVREVYMISNSVSLTLADGTVIPTNTFSLSIDYQSWTWGLTATVAYASLAMFGFDESGDPVQVWAHVNGQVFKLFVQAGSSQRQFPSGTVSLTGIGLISTLDAPYSPTLTFDNAGSDKTAQQIANDALTENGVSIGWAVEWGLVDWLVPARAWSFQGTYATALQTIAAAAGGYLQPHPTDLTARILPLYPTPPWEWAAVTPDFELPSAVTLVEGIAWSSLPEYNAVWVSGANGQGVLAEVKRTGTAGDVLATMVTDALITHADAARQRGVSILGNTGKQALVSLQLPVLSETGVILPGKFVRYIDGGVSRIGIVRSTQVDVNFPAVWQTIGVETHVD